MIDKIRGAAEIFLNMTMTRDVRLPPMVIESLQIAMDSSGGR